MADISEKRTVVVEIPLAIMHPAVDPKPITYVVVLNPEETPTDYDMSGGIPGDWTLDWFSTRDFPVEEDSSIEDIIRALEHEFRDNQNDHVVECWHRRDRLWVIFYNHRRYVDPEGKWEDYFTPHEKGVCNWPEEDCESCLMAGILRHTGLDHGMTSRESALEKIKSFVDYWIWEDGELRA
jgi:hypothetical protein